MKKIFYLFVIAYATINLVYSQPTIGEGWNCVSPSLLNIRQNVSYGWYYQLEPVDVTLNCSIDYSIHGEYQGYNEGEEICATGIVLGVEIPNHGSNQYMASTCISPGDTGGMADRLCGDPVRGCCCYIHHIYDIFCYDPSDCREQPWLTESCATSLSDRSGGYFPLDPGSPIDDKPIGCIRNTCRYAKKKQCEDNAYCADLNDCQKHATTCQTATNCTDNKCTFEPMQGCCTSDDNCQDISGYNLTSCTNGVCDYDRIPNFCESNQDCNQNIIGETLTNCTDNSCQFELQDKACENNSDCKPVPCAKKTKCSSYQCQNVKLIDPSTCCADDQTSEDTCCFDQLDCQNTTNYFNAACNPQTEDCEITYIIGSHNSVLNLKAEQSGLRCTGYCQNENCTITFTWEPNENLDTIIGPSNNVVTEYIIKTYYAEKLREIARVPYDEYIYKHETNCQGQDKIYFISAINDQEEEIGYTTMIIVNPIEN